jgi:hypothetical protein
MVSNSALRYLNISGSRKQQVEVFFDIQNLMNQFSGGSKDD